MVNALCQGPCFIFFLYVIRGHGFLYERQTFIKSVVYHTTKYVPIPKLSNYRVCLPLVSIGSRHIETNAAKNNAPEAYIGADGLAEPA